MECKEALQKNEGDHDKAIAFLREKGFAQAAKRSDRETSQGVVESYIHTGGRVGALVELGCETDFVARTEDFQSLAHEIAMQVAAMAPKYVSLEDKKDDDGSDTQVVLLEQPYIKDSSQSIKDLIQELAAKVGENIRVIRFARLGLGE
ncbi:MAG TPA: elongation factor Ts [Dehalococcoidia bacterium]|nr:elongation factor Ts [Dehalococcoidia bacterium]